MTVSYADRMADFLKTPLSRHEFSTREVSDVLGFDSVENAGAFVHWMRSYDHCRLVKTDPGKFTYRMNAGFGRDWIVKRWSRLAQPGYWNGSTPISEVVIHG